MEQTPGSSKKEMAPIGERISLSFEIASPLGGGESLDTIPVKLLVAEAAQKAFEQTLLALGENEQAASHGRT